jgi:hypothetical protein
MFPNLWTDPLEKLFMQQKSNLEVWDDLTEALICDTLFKEIGNFTQLGWPCGSVAAS